MFRAAYVGGLEDERFNEVGSRAEQSNGVAEGKDGESSTMESRNGKCDKYHFEF